MPSSSAPVSAARAMTRPLARINPTATGVSPALTTRIATVSAQRVTTRPAISASSDDGSMIATVATAIPAGPAIRQPIRLTSRMFGPGAAWETANRCAKVASSIQPSTVTTCRWISGSTALAPPIATSDNAANVVAIDASIAVMAAPPPPRS